jgi:Mu-like prophage I protein
MNRHNPQAIALSGFKADLFSKTLVPNALPTEVQFMPPGLQDIVPFVDGEPFPMTIKVDQELADKLNTQLQVMRQKASKVEGDVPFIDFNHEDAEASGEVLELFWGGPEMTNGGIRMKINWTDAGKAAIKGKMYRRFSPAWLIDKDTSEPLGIGPNLGGLVNRAAFQKIQPIVAKSGLEKLEMFTARAMDVALVPMHREVEEMRLSCQRLITARARHSDPVAVSAIPTDRQPDDFFNLVKARKAEKKISLGQAVREIQSENPRAAVAYARALINPTQAPLVGKAANSRQQGFLCEVQAKQLGGMSFDNAVRAITFSRPGLVEEYRRSFHVKGK